MQVDTGQFAALTEQVAELAEQIHKLKLWDVYTDTFFAAGYEAGQSAARSALLGRAAETSAAATPRRSHLRAVDGGAS
jgi:hypothetical protein